MKNKTLVYIIVILVIVLGLYLFTLNDKNYVNNDVVSQPNVSDNVMSDNTSEGVISDTPSEYTMTDVSLHNNESNCWTAINGFIYNVTSWIPQHPGGRDKIISLCGIDGSSAFNSQHGEQARPASELENFRIGVLK